MKKTVLYIGGFELPDKNAAAQRVVANAKLLRAVGYDVVFLGVEKNVGDGEKIIRYEEDFFGFPSYAVKYPESAGEWLTFICNISPIVQVAEEREAGLIVAYNFPALALFRLLKWGQPRKVKVVADCTEWYLPEGNIFRRTVKAADICLRMRFVHPRLNGLIAISRYLYEWYEPKMKNVVLLPPLVDKSDEKWNAGKTRSENAVPAFVYAGSPGRTKDRLDWIIGILFDAFKIGKKPFRFSVLGITEEDFAKKSQLPCELRAFVSFYGRVAHRKAIGIVSNSDYQIFFRERNLPNTAGFPTKFVESISCGTPVVANRISNIEDYLRDGKNGVLVELSNREGAVETMVELMSGEDAARPMVETEIFDYRRYKSIMADFFKSVLNAHS